MVSIATTPSMNTNNFAMQKQAQQALIQANLVAANNQLRVELIASRALERLATQPNVDALQLEAFSRAIDPKPGFRGMEFNA